MTWFEKLFGFSEESPEQVRKHIQLNGERMRSNINGREIAYGRLETPTLAELRKRLKSKSANGSLVVSEIFNDVKTLHADLKNANALFQVASQFNLLEMTSPTVTPESGVGIYEFDHTQGPSCAIAAGGGTVYRNYFATVNGSSGQSAHNQINCIADLGSALGNEGDRLWEMRNGYVLPSQAGLEAISQKLSSSDEQELDLLRGLLRIGIQWDTEVSISDSRHLVSQAYCSALPVAYTKHSKELWSRFAQLVLDAAYEATICAAIINLQLNGNPKVYLTLLGGGAFGNELSWINKAMYRSFNLFKNFPLEVVLVRFRQFD